MPEYYRIQDVSKDVSRYIREKGLQLSPTGWRDIYAAEHANAFTVAKLKDMSLLGQVQKEVGQSIEHGDSFEHFRERMQPKAQKWLDSVRRDPPPELEDEDLANWKKKKDRYRLRRIFETNTRQAYAQHHYNRGMDNEFNTHIIYRIGPSINHRADHVAIDGTVLPKDHPFWDTHWPPNGWNCKCYARFITADKLEAYRKDGLPDIESIDQKTGHITKNKPINEQAPRIKWRNFRRSDGKAVWVPSDIDPGFEWNPGKFNRGTWLKDQAVRKARALDLAPKKLQQLEQLIVSNPAQQQAYAAFVDTRYGRQSNGQNIDVGLVQGALKDDFLKRQADLPDSDLVMMQDKVLNVKNKKHKDFAHADSSVSKQEFLRVPEILKTPDMLLWDRKRQQYIIVKHTRQRQLLFLPIGINRIKAIKGNHWTLRSVYRVESFNEALNERWKDLHRYELLNPKKR